MIKRQRPGPRILGSLLLIGACVGSPNQGTPPAAPGQPPLEVLEGEGMQRGLDAFNKDQNYDAASAAFREVLAMNPDHYGASIWLAQSLNHGTDARAKKAAWTHVLSLAVEYHAEDLANEADANLCAPDIVAIDMEDGLDALYAKNDAAGAIDLFRRVLEANPDHYGGIYQMAVGLSRASDPAAREAWERVLAMATEHHDEGMATDARDHLGKLAAPR